MTNTADAGARMALREATAAAHARLHHLPAFASLQAGTIGREEYASLLRRMFVFHRAVESVLGRSAVAVSLRHRSRRAPARGAAAG